jgi:hypothetical protein
MDLSAMLRLPIFCALLAAAAFPQARIPDFSLPDQSGSSRTFADIRGPNGAMVVFYRSADW